MTAPVTLKNIAVQAGLSTAAVSYALRGSDKVSPQVRSRVRKLAEKMGYRTNPRVRELMSQIRSGRAIRRGDVLALVCIEGHRGQFDFFMKSIIDAATRCASERGFQLEVFVMDELENSPRRLASILHARGVAGVVFAPVQQRTKVQLDWPWELFPVAVVGMAEWEQPVPRAGHHHYEAMRRALRHLKEIGAKRPACWINREDDERAHRGWRSAWLGSDVEHAAQRLYLGTVNPDPVELVAWLKNMNPDSLIVSHPPDLVSLRAAGWTGGPDHTVLLSWKSGMKACGVDQCYERIAAAAVDLVFDQLNRNSRGLPDTPRMLLFPGDWHGAE